MSRLTHVQGVRLLYKSCLKLHRGLPLELQAIGDSYVKEEFRRHKTASPEHTQVFMQQWAVSVCKKSKLSRGSFGYTSTTDYRSFGRVLGSINDLSRYFKSFDKRSIVRRRGFVGCSRTSADTRQGTRNCEAEVLLHF